jgi:hypothetical protein
LHDSEPTFEKLPDLGVFSGLHFESSKDTNRIHVVAKFRSTDESTSSVCHYQ